ncbi:MAG TPA: hypothetical protein VGG02_11645 [Chthoniobacterales bacterium]|jgi:hypothetical protein
MNCLPFLIAFPRAKRRFCGSAAVLAAMFAGGCATVAPYDQAAYEHATNVKVDTLALVSKATGNYGDNLSEIKNVNLALQKAYEYDKDRSLNTSTRKEWEDLLVEKNDDPKSGIIPRFLERWQRKGSLKPHAVADDRQNISDAFDMIIQSENGKNRSSQTK